MVTCNVTWGVREGSNCCRTKYHDQRCAADVLWSSGWNDRTRLVHPTQSSRSWDRWTVRKHYTHLEQNLITVCTAYTVCAYIIHSVSFTCTSPKSVLVDMYSIRTHIQNHWMHIYIQTTHMFTNVHTYCIHKYDINFWSIQYNKLFYITNFHQSSNTLSKHELYYPLK